MTPSTTWLDALKLPLKITIAVAVSSGLLLALDLNGYLDYGEYAALARAVFITLTVVSSVFVVVGIITVLSSPLWQRQRQSALALRRSVRRKEQEDLRAAERVRVLAHLDHLSEEEIWYVADALKKGSPSFLTYVHSPPVSLLGGKGLVWTPGGEHNRNYYPYSFHDFVWEQLLERKDEFLAKHEENERAKREAK